MMVVVGMIEWWYLIRLTTRRETKTALPKGETSDLTAPTDVSHDPLINRERERSQANNEGINARDLVKVFSVKDRKQKKAILKKAVKGVSFGIRKNEIFALLGPNGE